MRASCSGSRPGAAPGRSRRRAVARSAAGPGWSASRHSMRQRAARRRRRRRSGRRRVRCRTSGRRAGSSPMVSSTRPHRMSRATSSTGARPWSPPDARRVAPRSHPPSPPPGSGSRSPPTRPVQGKPSPARRPGRYPPLLPGYAEPPGGDDVALAAGHATGPVERHRSSSRGWWAGAAQDWRDTRRVGSVTCVRARVPPRSSSTSIAIAR